MLWLTYHTQAFHDEYEADRIQYETARAEWEAKVDPEKLKLINRQRVARGQKRVIIHRPVEQRRPLTGFTRCVHPSADLY